MRTIFFDTETSGLKPGQIGQLTAIIIEGDHISTRNYFFEMDSIEDGAAEVTHRDLNFYNEASGGKRFADYANEIAELFNGSTLVAHNLKFDENFLSIELWRQKINLLPGDRFCTMNYFRDIIKLPNKYGRPGYKNPRLEEVVDFLKIDNDKVMEYTKQIFGVDCGFHDSRFDTVSMYVAYNLWLEKTNGGNQWQERFLLK